MTKKIKGAYLYLLLLVLHTGIAFYAFEPFISNPGKVLFNNAGDGLKNYFTIYTYAKDPIGKDGFFKYDKLAYPYGEYVYSTDNTPGFSMALRWYCRNVNDVSGYSTVIFNWYIILHFIIAGTLVFYIFRNLVRNDLFAFMAAIILPWINIQLPRIWNGHYNLALFSLVLGAICLLVAWHKNRGHVGRLWLIALLLCGLCFFAFLHHGYYIAIITVFVAMALFIYGLLYRKERLGIVSIAASVIIPAVTLALALLLMQFTDGYLHLRPYRAEGYDYMEMKTKFSSLFSAYYFHTFYFPVRNATDANHEHAAYLGNISLYATAIIGLLSLYSKEFRQRVKDIQVDFFKDKLRLTLVIAGLLMLSISLGEIYFTSPEGFMIYNFLNPFFYVHFVTDYIEQFRGLARFNWPFFAVYNIWAVYTIAALYMQYNKKVQRVILVLFILLGYVEMKDFINELRGKAGKANYLEAASIQKEFEGLRIDYSKYQAILPIPFYNVGSEDYRYTIDDYELWSQFTFRLGIYSDLPSMANRLSRTPPAYAKAIIDLVARDIVDTSLHRLLNEKPVLVVTNKTYVSMNILPPRNDTAMVYYEQAADFVERHGLQPIDSLYSDVYFYEWYPGRH